MKNSPLLAALLLGALAAPGCQVVAAAGLGFAVSQEFSDNAHSLRLVGNVDQVWHATLATLDSLSLDPLETDESTHAVQAVVRGAQVTARVRAHNATESVISVTAKRVGRYENSLAEEILFRVRDRM
ncbi:MAG: hypothetical protein R3F33_10975 [Planctomycetota bacterium]